VQEYKKGYEEWKAYAEKLEQENQVLKQKLQPTPQNTQNSTKSPFCNSSSLKNDHDRIFSMFFGQK
jgi:hypothetical protein